MKLAVILALLVVIALPVLAVAFLYLLARPAFGSRPSDGDVARFQRSPQYDHAAGIFVNRRAQLLSEMRKSALTVKGLIQFFRKGTDRQPHSRLPEVKPDLRRFLEPSTDLKVIWFGHSTFLLNMDGKIILVDPVFSGSASPLRFMIRRFQPPALALAELPAIDYILLSHDHYDHLDKAAVEFFADKNTPFIAPLGVAAHLIGWGIGPDRITQLDWWESHAVAGLEFIAAPAQHFSGRDGIHDCRTLWASWVIRSDRHRLFFSGDSGYDIHFKEVGERFGPFDVAFLETGQYNERWKQVHMMPEEGAQAYVDLRAKHYFPVHWGMFVLALHTWKDPIERISRAARERGISLISPVLGEIVTINDDYRNRAWWEDLN